LSGRTRTGDPCRAASTSAGRASTWRQSTPAAIAAHRRSPCSTPRCAIGSSGNAEGVHKDNIGQRRQRQHRALHGAQGRLMDVDAVDFRGIGAATAHAIALPVISL